MAQTPPATGAPFLDLDPRGDSREPSISNLAFVVGGVRSPAVSYVERPVASPLVACTWEQIEPAARELQVVPDACVDLIWSGEGLSVAGPDTKARVLTIAPGTRFVAGAG